MRTLFITDWVPFPLTAGVRKRIYHLLRAVSAVSDVTLVTLDEDARHGALRSLCKEIYLFPKESCSSSQDERLGKFRRTAKKLGRYLHPSTPVIAQVYRSDAKRDLIRKLSFRGFDLIWCARAWSASDLPDGLTSRVVVDIDDLEHRKLVHKWQNAGLDLKLPLDCLEYLKWRHFYHHLLRSHYELLVCSEQDKKLLGGGSRVWVVPNGSELAEIREHPQSNGTQREAIVFTGLMDYGPNIDAVKFFLGRVFPMIRREMPSVQFFIVGARPAPPVARMHDGQSVIVTGYVPEIEPYYGLASVVIAPIRFGGGTRIKILDAFAHSNAVVSTSLGAAGLAVEPGRHLLIADSAAEFAAACLAVLRDRALRHNLGAEGRALVRDNYQWEGIERRVQGIVTRRSHSEMTAATNPRH